MKLAFAIAAVAALSLSAVGTASAGVEFGKPDFPNYLAPHGPGTCDWWTEAWLHACPTPGPAVVAAPAIPVKASPKKGR
jgi:hypothetical protein